MKNLIIIFGVLLALSGCKEFENSAEVSVPTYLPYIEIFGDAYVEVECDNASYSDEGAQATESGEIIDLETSIVGTYFGASEVDGPDYYYVNYSAENVDGIAGVSSREIYFPECNGDFSTSIAGMYTAAVYRIRESTGTLEVNYLDAAHGPYWVKDLGGGQYGFSCAIGQFYEYGAAYGYGPDYAGTGLVIQANDIGANDFSVVSTNGVGAFGGSITVSDFSIDAVAKTISWSVDWSFNYHFDVVLTQVAE